MKKLFFLSVVFVTFIIYLASCSKSEEITTHFDQNEEVIHARLPWPKIKIEVDFGRNKMVDGVRVPCIDKGLCKIKIEGPVFLPLTPGKSSAYLEYNNSVLTCEFIKSSINAVDFVNFSDGKIWVDEDIELDSEITDYLNLPLGYTIVAGEYLIVEENQDHILVEF